MEHDNAMHENNFSAQLDHSRQLWRTTCGCGQERGSLSLFQPDSVANGGERRIYWLDCPEDHRQQYCHCLYCRAQIIATRILRGGEYIAALSKRHSALQEPTLALVRSKKPLFIFDALCSLVFRSLFFSQTSLAGELERKKMETRVVFV